MSTPILRSGSGPLGVSVFANRRIPAGAALILYSGPLIERAHIPEILAPEDDRYFQVDIDTFLGPSGGLDDMVNHSCNPNCVVKETEWGPTLIALRTIEKNGEITFDYSTWMYREPWTIPCLCGSAVCRGTIAEFMTLPHSLRAKYIALGAVPAFIRNNLSIS